MRHGADGYCETAHFRASYRPRAIGMASDFMILDPCSSHIHVLAGMSASCTHLRFQLPEASL
jgi:hypothetical protein